MTDFDVILEKLDAMGKKVDRMETAISVMADQGTRIDYLTQQAERMWKWTNHTEARITTIERFQSSCPGDSLEKNANNFKADIKSTVKGQWIAIGILASALAATGFWKGVVA